MLISIIFLIHFYFNLMGSMIILYKMRFDNPINEHFVEFPDIASFPELNDEYRFQKEVDLSPLYDSHDDGNFEKFNSNLDDIIDISKKEVPISENEIKLGNKWSERLKYYFDFYQNFYRNSEKIETKCWEDLYEYGHHVTTIDTKNIYNLIKNNIDKLLSQPDWDPPPGTYDRGEQLGPEIIKEVNNIFESCNIIKSVNAYNNRNLSVKNVFLHIAKPSDKNWKQFLQDKKITPKLTNMHIDPKEDVIKAMIYLEDVNKNNGPISYIPTSNRFIYDPLQNIFGRAISTGSYCFNPDSRASVFRLPKKLRITHNFGRLVLDDSNLEKNLLKNMETMTSDKGNVIVFDPGNGIHYGGTVKEGRRIALQILMK